MSTEDLIAALQGGGRVDSEGSFTLNREKAREKLRTFQVAEPQKYVLHLVALAMLKKATKVHVRCDSDDVVVQFDGLPITAADLDDLYSSSFSAARTDGAAGPPTIGGRAARGAGLEPALGPGDQRGGRGGGVDGGASRGGRRDRRGREGGRRRARRSA